MKLALRIIAAILLLPGLAFSLLILLAGYQEEPTRDMEAVWLGIAGIVWCLGAAYLIYRGYKNRSTATNVLALVLSALPMLILGVSILVADLLEEL